MQGGIGETRPQNEDFMRGASGMSNPHENVYFREGERLGKGTDLCL